MTKFIFKRSDLVPGLSDVEIETELTESELELVKQIIALEHDGRISQAVESGSFGVRQYKTRHSCPYGYRLIKPKSELYKMFREARDYITSSMSFISRVTPYAIEPMMQILSLYKLLLVE